MAREARKKTGSGPTRGRDRRSDQPESQQSNEPAVVPPGRVFAMPADDLEAISACVETATVHDDIVVVELADNDDDALAAVAAIEDLGVRWIAPVEITEAGDESVPTGEVTVRFEEAPDDEQLVDFAKSHDLEVRTRNEFVAKQVVFAPKKGQTIRLKQVEQELDESEGIEAAWMNTKTTFRRE